jgi:hypothetical protein
MSKSSQAAAHVLHAQTRQCAHLFYSCCTVVGAAASLNPQAAEASRAAVVAICTAGCQVLQGHSACCAVKRQRFVQPSVQDVVCAVSQTRDDWRKECMNTTRRADTAVADTCAQQLPLKAKDDTSGAGRPPNTGGYSCCSCRKLPVKKAL